LTQAELLTFDLWVSRGPGYPQRLGGLGFAPDHPAYWAALPADAELYDPDAAPPARYTGLWERASSPRFPLAGGAAGAFTVPLDMPLFPDAPLGAVPQPGSALERDGLADFSAGQFLGADDPDALRTLVEAPAGRLQDAADFLRWTGPNPRPLGGIYSVLGIEEVTLLAVPDAVHRGWDWVTPPTPPPPVIPPAPTPPPAEPGFVLCRPTTLPTPVLTCTDPDADGSFTVRWDALPGTTVRYTLEEAAGPMFDEPGEIFHGADTRLEIRGRRPGVYRYRVRAEIDGAVTDWSDPRFVRVVPPPRWEVRPSDPYRPDDLLAVQRAVLRLCAARGDVLAALALPGHFRADAAAAHAAELMSGTGRRVAVSPSGPGPGVTSVPLNTGEATALSFGALYHPWLVGREEDLPGEVRRVPPDGAACGVLAARAIARGAWVAPANEPLRGVVQLAPDVPPEWRLALQEARVNLFRQEPRGFLALDADTLSPDDDLRPVNVRRLLALLRRLALRLGAGYVFEPSGGALRRAVRRGFEAALESLFVRGAFAGRSADDSYRVVVDDTVNPPAAVEQGRFVVELRVAPSRPLAFLTVRLVQQGDRGAVTEGT
jgi:hypothetical protein